MVREAYRKKSGLGSRIGGLLLINILPLAGLAALVWGVASGRVSRSALPEGLGRQAALIGAALIVLILVTSLILPLVHGAAKGLRLQLAVSAERRREGGALRAAAEWILWPFRQVFHLVFWSARFACYLASLGLIGAILLLAVRVAKPEFLAAEIPLERWIDRAEGWLREVSGAG